MILGFDMVLRAAVAFEAQQLILPPTERAWDAASLSLLTAALENAGMKPVEPPHPQSPSERSNT